MNGNPPASLSPETKGLNHVRIQVGQLFYQGAYTDFGRWVRAEEYERVAGELQRVKEQLAAELKWRRDNSND